MRQSWTQLKTFQIFKSGVWSDFGTSDSHGFKMSHHIVVSSRLAAKPSAGGSTFNKRPGVDLGVFNWNGSWLLWINLAA
jgi:hypothetical protein